MYTCYLNKSSEKMDEISQVFEAKYVNKVNEIGNFSYRKSRYLIKNGFLYTAEQEEFVLMDKRRIYMNKKEKELFNKRITVDHSGKVLKNEMR